MIHRTSHRRPILIEAPEAPGQVLSRLTRLVVSIAGLVVLFYFARSVVLPVLLAWVGSMALRPPVTWLREHHVPAPLAAGLVLMILGAVLALGLIHLGRPVADWVKSAPETLPRLREKYQRLFAPVSRISAAWNGLDGNTKDDSRPPAGALPAVGGGEIAGAVFTWTGNVLVGMCECAVLLYLLLASGDAFIYRFARALQKFGDKSDAAEICRQIQQNISTYLFSVTMINMVFGIAVGTTLYWAGLPNAAMWGAVAAVANFVPYFGPFAGVLAVAGAGLLASDTVGRGLLPAGVYLLWHLLEADFVTPLLLGRKFKMNAFVIFVMLMFCGLIWGVLGALLAMPLLVTLNVVCSRVPACSALGELLSS